MCFRQSAPLRPDGRVKDLFERASLRGVAKYYRANRGAIQLPAPRKHFCAKLLPDGILDVRKIDNLPRGLIRVEEPRLPQKLAQVITKCTLPGGNSASNSDGGHLLQ